MATKRLMAKALPDYLVNQVTAEVRLATRRMFTARSVRRSLASQKGCRVNIGCGKNPIQGWINLDVVSYPGVYFWDCRSGLPFSDAAVAAIYSEQLFDHLDAETEGRALLRECLRCLQPKGPASGVRAGRGAYLRAYSGPWELLADMRPLDRTVDGWRDRLLSHHASGQVVREYKNIRSATAGLGSTIFLYHHISNNAPPALPTRNLYLFSDESLSKLNYRMIGPTLAPGHVGFPVLQFFCDNPDFDYYWAIEYDVRFSGDWFFFFDSFKEANHDFWRATSVITPTNRIGHGGL